MSQLDLRGCLRHHPLFGVLSETDIGGLLPHVHELRYPRGQVLFQRGDVCDGVHLLITGMVKLSVTAPQGNEKIVELIRPGQSFGEAVMFLDRSYPVMAQALEDSFLLMVEKRAIVGAIEADPRFARSMLAGLSTRLHGLIRDVESYSMQNAVQRVIAFLLQCVADEDTQGYCVVLPVNKNLIASRLNLTPETLSRTLHQLVTQQLISVNGREIEILDSERLSQLLQPA